MYAIGEEQSQNAPIKKKTKNKKQNWNAHRGSLSGLEDISIYFTKMSNSFVMWRKSIKMEEMFSVAFVNLDSSTSLLYIHYSDYLCRSPKNRACDVIYLLAVEWFKHTMIEKKLRHILQFYFISFSCLFSFGHVIVYVAS